MPRRTEQYVLELVSRALAGASCRRQHTFDWLRGSPTPRRPQGTKLPVDGFFPDFNLVVEVKEKQHRGQGPALWDKRVTATGDIRREQRERYDLLREQAIPAHGLKLVVIHDNELCLEPGPDMPLIQEKLRGACIFRQFDLPVMDSPAI